MISLNYHHLFYFHAIAREGGVAKAARKLFLAQPTLSAQLKELETALKRKLFARTGRRLELTEDGRVVLRYADAIFRLGAELEDDLRDRPHGDALAVQLGVAAGTPRAFVHAWVDAALAQEPAPAVECREAPLETLLADLGEYRLDAILTGVCPPSGAPARLNSRKAAGVPVVFAAAPRLARGRAALPKGLRGLPLILPRAPEDAARQVREYLADAGLDTRGAVEVPDGETARRLALDGRGAAPLDGYTLERSRPTGGLAALDGDRPTGIVQSLWVSTAAGRLRPNPIAERLFKTFVLPG
ncbi:MAG: LysR family transcriptional regulator [Elusimicrobia bacterium]|nr:LysR family transcriptional regulator [Elusimicrobiota bacterium]